MAEVKGLYVTPPCAVEGCDHPASGIMEHRCHHHEALRHARELSTDDLVRLREDMMTVVPITDPERHDRRIRSWLRSVTRYAEELARAEASALKAGATQDQVTAARTNGQPATQNA